MFDLFSMENDSELDNIDVENSEIKNDETAVDAAADPQKPVEVNITEEQAAHNEAASAGGCVVGDNEEQLSMDPIAAEESYIRASSSVFLVKTSRKLLTRLSLTVLLSRMLKLSLLETLISTLQLFPLRQQ